MKILIIRHGDPDYSIDSLTEKGKIEAECLANRLKDEQIDKIYVSPLGRAQDTANYTLKAKNMTAETMPWLREFHAPVIDPETGNERLPWDLLPQDWAEVENYYNKDLWHTTELMKSGNVIKEALRVYDGIDKILLNHGYERNGNTYKVVKPNRDTIAFFCHFGVECVILSHLLGISPVLLWHGTCASPSSVTVLTSEERRQGIAYFRMNTFGDTGHLFANGEQPAFAGRFCEVFDSDERHD